MKVINKIECEKSFRKDGNTEYTPILKVIGKSVSWIDEQSNVIIQIDNSKKVGIDGRELIKAVRNAMNV